MTSDKNLEPLPRDIYSVSRLNHEVRDLLERKFVQFWIEGEISNWALPSSGHAYFSLKDANAQIRCAMFRAQRTRLKFTPKDGLHVLLSARVSLYEPRGDFQLIVEHMDIAGEGALRLAFEQLKQKLAHEGLFDSVHKKPLPRFPRCIGILTSPTGAALQDILSVLKRRCALIPIVLYPITVQGAKAGDSIVSALNLANTRQDCDVLILARGGGSLEDLWAFNEEKVVRALFASKLAVVAGIGHEVDVTLADFVADWRAPTPSAAAETLSPDSYELAEQVHALALRAQQAWRKLHEAQAQKLDWIHSRLQQQRPDRKLALHRTQTQQLNDRLKRVMRALVEKQSLSYQQIKHRLIQATPLHTLVKAQQTLLALERRLSLGITHGQHLKRQTLESLMRTLDSVSPLATLTRGYAVLESATVPTEIIRSHTQVAPAQRVRAHLADGTLVCEVISSSEKVPNRYNASKS